MRELAAVFAGGQHAVESQPLADELIERLVRARVGRACAALPSPRLPASPVRPAAAAANSSASGMVSQSAYESRLAVAYGFNFGSAVVVQPKQEVRRLQHRLHDQLRALQEIRLSVPSAPRSASALRRRADGGTPSARTRAQTRPAGRAKACTGSARAYRRRETRAAPVFPPPRCTPPSAAAKGSAPAY